MDFKLIIKPEMNVPMILNSDTRPELLVDFIQANHSDLIEQLRQSGAILFRGFACHDAELFSKAIESCNLGTRCSTADYDIARTVVLDQIYTSSELPPHIPLPMHHEKPRTKNPPNHLYFCCITPAPQGGATLFANAGAIWLDMPPDIQDKILDHGIVYKQFFHGKSLKKHFLRTTLNSKSARTWMESFGSDIKSQIEERLACDAMDWEWINDGQDLIVLNHLPGALTHPVTNQTLWFNSAGYLNYYANLLYGKLNELPFYKYLPTRYLIAKDMLPLVCHYGNKSPFSAAEITDINRVIHHHTYPLNWQTGDFMIVDNYTFMHGKEAHCGERLLYSCMTI